MQFNMDTLIFIGSGVVALLVLLPLIYSQRKKLES